MNQIARIGLDIAKRWFQIHAVDSNGREVLNRKLPYDKILGFLAALPRRAAPPWRPASDPLLEPRDRSLGPSGDPDLAENVGDVKPYLRRGKSNAHDASAICEAASRPEMRFVRVKHESGGRP
jgi:transposase